MNLRPGFLILLLFSAILAGCTSTARLSEDKELAALGTAADDTDKMGALESGVLAHSQRRASRNGDTLILATKNAGAVRLQNHSACDDATEEHCRFFVLVADLASRNTYIVAVNYYEGGNFLMIDDRTGRQTELSGAPYFGPNDDVFLTIDNDEEFESPGVEIWRRSGDTASVVFSRKPEEDCFTTLKAWDSDGIHLDFESQAMLGKTPRHWRGTIRQDGSGWRYTEDKPAVAAKGG